MLEGVCVKPGRRTGVQLIDGLARISGVATLRDQAPDGYPWRCACWLSRDVQVVICLHTEVPLACFQHSQHVAPPGLHESIMNCGFLA
jgi:hypothetical protein